MRETQQTSESLATISPTSLELGDTLTVRVENISGYSNMSIHVSKICDEFDKSAFSVGTTPVEKDGGLELTVNAKTVSSHGPGLYLVTAIRLLDPIEPSEKSLPLVRAPELLLFEVVDGGLQRSSAELSVSYRAIIEARAAIFNAGIGRTDAKGVFKAFVFVRDCLLRTPMHFDQVELLPLDGTACNDELEVMQMFLKKAERPLLGDTRTAVERHRINTPGLVLHFPRILADNAEDALSVLASETDALCNTLSLFRGSYAAPFAEVLQQEGTDTYFYRMLAPGYRGNLLSGGLAGESPWLIRDAYRAAKSSPLIELYLSLLRDALGEERVEFRYFRLWSLLETIARANGYIGQPKRDWEDAVVTNQAGQPILIQHAKELVLELVRQVFRAGTVSRNIGGGLACQDVEALIPIWYRHRNCVGHTGSCRPEDPGVCKPGAGQYVRCKAAHDEICQGGRVRDMYNDGYLKALERTVNIVIGRQVANYLQANEAQPD